MTTNHSIRRYADFVKTDSGWAKARTYLRDAVIRVLSLKHPKKNSEGWIRFPYYHHVFDDECEGFERQLLFFKNNGDVIGIDDAISLLCGQSPIRGQYFCITFDDGFKNWIENAVPILVSNGMVAAFFIATDYIGLDITADEDRLLKFFPEENRLIEFLNWEDCALMLDAGMTIGSHTVSHKNLMKQSVNEIKNELKKSKSIIEEKTGSPCNHFCCPFGREGIDFLTEYHPKLAAEAGYQSFLTGHRGPNIAGTSPYYIHRDHLLANWKEHQLRYFLHCSSSAE